MACDFERKYLYYTQLHLSDEDFIKIFRVDDDGGDIKTISDTAELTTGPISVDLETGNLYYYSSKGIGLYSYTLNYSKTVISNTALVGDYVYDIGFHGTGSNKRVYWSTEYKLYRSQPGTSELINSGRDCVLFSILENGIVCYQLLGRDLHVANLNGVKTESLPNMTITSSILKNISCSGPDFIEDITTVDGHLYIVCQSPTQVLKVDLKTGIRKVLIPKRTPALKDQTWLYICVLPRVKVVLTDQKVVPPTQTVTTLPVSTILMVSGGVAIGLVMIVSLIATIRTCKKTVGSVPTLPDEPEYSSYNSSSLVDVHVYNTIDSKKSTEVYTVDDHIYTEIL
ncbi:uncharacterized protein LOC126816591 [Patella vulgata]|uniref:uncharacterized protein LOC126816591 n=1 Tax=Patella vulgata TaxID=6465 RepID=UPI002180504E|nr:uncharacterized protein LOC126816591 [Patella vulgata]